MRDVPALTGLRGIAALGVLFYHLYFEWEHFLGLGASLPGLRFGWVGVDVFFVLSAFLLGWILLDRPVRDTEGYARWVRRRWVRIAPAYYVAILASLLLTGTLAYVLLRPGDVALHALFLHSLDLDTYFTINPAFWTLAVEFQFYLLLPLLIPLYRSRHWPLATAGLVMLAILWRAVFTTGEHAWLSFSLPAFMAHFALGMAAARLHADGWTTRLPPRWAAASAGGLLIVAPLVLLLPAGTYHQVGHPLVANMLARPLLAAGVAMLLLGLAGSTRFAARALGSKAMVYAGQRSYSLYLIHVPLLLAARAFEPLLAHGFLAYALIGTGLCMVGAEILYQIAERPILDARRRGTPTPRLEPQPKPTLGILDASPPTLPGRLRSPFPGMPVPQPAAMVSSTPLMEFIELPGETRPRTGG